MLKFGDPEVLQKIRDNGDLLEGSNRIRFVENRIRALYDRRQSLTNEAVGIKNKIDAIEESEYGDIFEAQRLQGEYRKKETAIEEIESEISTLEEELE